MEAKFINPFINATLNVLKTMAYVSSKPGKPYIKKDDTASGYISGIIGITGKTRGTITVTFDEGSILKIVSGMFGEEMKEVNDEIADAVGEITNMISGQARQELERVGYLFKGAIPSVIMGEKHRLISITKGPKIAIPFSTNGGNFTMEISLEHEP